MLPSTSLAVAVMAILLPVAKLAPAVGAAMLAAGAWLGVRGAAWTTRIASRTRATVAAADRICVRDMTLEPRPAGAGQTGASVRATCRRDGAGGHKARDRRSV